MNWRPRNRQVPYRGTIDRVDPTAAQDEKPFSRLLRNGLPGVIVPQEVRDLVMTIHETGIVYTVLLAKHIELAKGVDYNKVVKAMEDAAKQVEEKRVSDERAGGKLPHVSEDGYNWTMHSLELAIRMNASGSFTIIVENDSLNGKTIRYDAEHTAELTQSAHNITNFSNALISNLRKAGVEIEFIS